MVHVLSFGLVIYAALLAEVNLTYGECDDCVTADNDDCDGCVAAKERNLPPYPTESGLYFPSDYYTQYCRYLSTVGECYELQSGANCTEPPPPEILSEVLCRHKEALKELVPCLNDRDFLGKLVAVFEEKSDCENGKELIKRQLRLVKERCGVKQYKTMKTVYQEYGDYLIHLFVSTNPEECSIDVNAITTDISREINWPGFGTLQF